MFVPYKDSQLLVISNIGFIMSFMQELDVIIKKENLKQKALDGAKNRASSGEVYIDKDITESFEFFFKSHKLRYKHMDHAYPAIETKIGIKLQNKDVGYYTQTFELVGMSLHGVLVVTNEGLKHK